MPNSFSALLGIGHHPIYTDRRQRNAPVLAKATERERFSQRLSDGIRDELIPWWRCVLEREAFVDGEDLLANRTGHTGGVQRSAHSEGHIARGKNSVKRLPVREVNLFAAFDVERIVLHVPITPTMVRQRGAPA